MELSCQTNSSMANGIVVTGSMVTVWLVSVVAEPIGCASLSIVKPHIERCYV